MSRDYGSFPLHRNFSPKMTLYGTDGRGRDNYIHYNNGGFWKENMKDLRLKDQFEVTKYSTTHRSLKKNVAPFNYYSDGTGRDSYVVHESGGLKRDSKPMKTFHLKNFLRTSDSKIFNFRASPMKEGVAKKTLYVTKKELTHNNQLKKLEHNLNIRLYYNRKNKEIFKGPKDQKYQTMLRTYGNNFPSIQKSFRCEKIESFESFNKKLQNISRYKLASP